MLFKNYHYFQTIAEQRNITRAAEKLYISQSSLSKYLSRLEERVGVKLIDHDSSPLILTYAGERYLDYIRQVTFIEKQMQADFSEYGTQSTAVIRLGITPWHASCELPQILKSFWDQHSNIRVELFEKYSDVLNKMLISEQLDFCIMMQPHDILNLSREVIKRQQIILAICKQNPILQKIQQQQSDNDSFPVINIQQLKGERLILPKQSHVFSQLIYNLLENSGIYFPIAIEIENFTTSLNLVAENIGITFLLDGKSQLDRYPNVAFFHVDELSMCDLCIVYKNMATLNKQSLLMIRHIKNYYGNLKG